MKNFLSLFLAVTAILIALPTANAQKLSSASCQNLPSESQLRQLLVQAQNVNKPIGGLFDGMRMWAVSDLNATELGELRRLLQAKAVGG